MKILLVLIAVALFATVTGRPADGDPEDLSRWDVIKLANKRVRAQEEAIGHQLDNGVILDAVIEGMRKVNGGSTDGDDSNRREIMKDFLNNHGEGLGQKLEGEENQRGLVVDTLLDKGNAQADGDRK
ncbi:hypothetical protein Bbelb_001590 [Branchiostoma belcheri]|nr:hypothetical protein Bbelb_001590 [Branchiostoma belcheri]